MFKKKIFWCLIFVAAAAVCMGARALEGKRLTFMDIEGRTDAAMPAQPATGPGGSEYPHADMDMYHYGSGNDELWIFEPAAPAPESAPVIIFLHGWAAMYPKMYGAWIRHLVQRGNIVVYPRYQESIKVHPPVMFRSMLDAVARAFDELGKPGHVRPDLERVAAVGHSFGGVMTGNLASVWQAEGLPRIRAAMPVQPGDGSREDKSTERRGFPSIMADFSTMPADTLLICVAGADDTMVGDYAARKICSESTAVPPGNKNLIIMRSDDHGTPPLVADHFQPLAGDDALTLANEKAPPVTRGLISNMKQSGRAVHTVDRFAPDAQDYNGLWRLFDALTECAFSGAMCEKVLGDGPAVGALGAWSDGEPVLDMLVNPADQ